MATQPFNENDEEGGCFGESKGGRQDSIGIDLWAENTNRKEDETEKRDVDAEKEENAQPRETNGEPNEQHKATAVDEDSG